MKRTAIALLLTAGFALPGRAETAPASAPPETVTVTGTRQSPQQVIHNFIASYAAPTTLLGKIARWKDGLCPKVMGLQPNAQAFIEKRVRDVAGKVGARLDVRPDCPGNIEIVFTPQPQVLLNQIRKKSPGLLGFNWGSPSMMDRLALVRHPVQGWYATQTEDNNGTVQRDETYDQCIARTNSPVRCPGAVAVSGFFGTNGLKSQLFNVLIVADVTKVGSHSVSALADYVSMLALSQGQDLDKCKNLPSIANLLAEGCDAGLRVEALTEADLSLLRALYKIAPDAQRGNQIKDIAAQMEKDNVAPQ